MKWIALSILVTMSLLYLVTRPRVRAWVKKATTATPASPGAGHGIGEKAEAALTVAGVVAGILLIAWGILSASSAWSDDPDFLAIARGFRANWLKFAAGWAIIAIALWVANRKKDEKDKKWLKPLLRWPTYVLLFLIVGVPAGLMVRDAFLSQVICPNATARETRECLLNTGWSTWISAEQGERGGICYSPGGKEEYVREGSISSIRFKASEGKLLKQYRLFPAGTDCSKVKL